MVHDLNNDEYRKELSDAANSKDGKIIVDFLNHEADKLSFEDIKEELTFQEKGLEYESIKKARDVLKKCLRYLT